MNANNKKFGLGRGLEALLGDEDINLDLDSETADVSNLVENTVFKSEKNEIKIYYYVDLSLEKFNIEELKNYSLGEVYTDTKILFEKVIYENRTQNN